MGTRLSGSQCRLLYDISINTATYLLPLMSIISFLLCTRLDVLIVIVWFIAKTILMKLYSSYSINSVLKKSQLFCVVRADPRAGMWRKDTEYTDTMQSSYILSIVPSQKGGQLKFRTSKSKDSSINVIEQKIVSQDFQAFCVQILPLLWAISVPLWCIPTVCLCLPPTITTIK